MLLQITTVTADQIYRQLFHHTCSAKCCVGGHGKLCSCDVHCGQQCRVMFIVASGQQCRVMFIVASSDV